MRLSSRIFFEQVEALLTEGREVQIRMRGHSMRPLLRDGRDTAVVAPLVRTAAQQPDTPRIGAGHPTPMPIVDMRPTLRRGDVVLFRCGDCHILHRIVHRCGDDFVLAGDGNYRITERCRTADILARLERVVRPSGRTIECRSLRWRLQSRLWLALPSGLRRFLLRATWHLGLR